MTNAIAIQWNTIILIKNDIQSFIHKEIIVISVLQKKGYDYYINIHANNNSLCWVDNWLYSVY